MTLALEETTMHTVASRDGTEIAYRMTGDGPPLVMVHGTTADHTRWTPLLPHLEPHVTVVAMDRRGRRDTPDTAVYDLTREFEDVAAVVDAVAASCGSAVDVYGHSFGAWCALGGALLTGNIRKLVLYEPLVNGAVAPWPDGFAERLDDLLARGDREGVVLTLFGEAFDMSEDDKNEFRAMPSWPMRVANAHTATRETRAEMAGVFDADGAGQIGVPTLMFSGEESPDYIKADTRAVADAFPDVRVIVLEGQAHIADLLVPDVFAAHLLAFLRDG